VHEDHKGLNPVLINQLVNGRQHEDREMLFNERAIGSQRYPNKCARVVALRNHVSSCRPKFEQETQCTYMVTLKHICITIVAVESMEYYVL
jgi:hypothetical protein